MKKYWLLTLGLILVFFVSACQALERGIEPHNYWIRAAQKGENTAMYMLLHNHSSTKSDELIGASSDVAEVIELHETKMDSSGIMQMSPLPSIPLPPDAEVHFEPGGLHLMFIGLKQDLKPGDKVKVTLHFRNREDITLTVPVREGTGEGSEHTH